jgi:hypothetical protein
MPTQIIRPTEYRQRPGMFPHPSLEDGLKRPPAVQTVGVRKFLILN